jgi:uncharacterized protein with NRDE domain
MTNRSQSSLEERVASAIRDAEEVGYSIRLTRLLDEESTFTLTYPSTGEVYEFESHADALEHVVQRKYVSRAQAAIRAVQESAESANPNGGKR